MDILKFIKSQRISSISLYALLSREQRKFAEKLAETILSEYSSPESTCSDSNDEYYNPPDPSKNTDQSYIISMLKSNDAVDQRMVAVYDQKDKVRTHKWFKGCPDALE